MFTIPNAITLLNLISGCVATMYAFHGELYMSFLFVALAAVFDFLDGFAARALGQYSEIGKQLDSLADVVSFGVAPSAMLFNLFCYAGGEAAAGWSVFVLAGFSALRLARFNIDDTQTEEFRGMPTPACALMTASAASGWADAFLFSPWAIIAFVALMCFLLVSPIRMFSFKFHSWGLRENGLRYGFALFAAAILAWMRADGVFIVVAAYVGVSAVRAAACKKSAQ